MANVEFKMNPAGFAELRRDPAIVAMCKDHADRVAAAAGEGFEASERQYGGRAPRTGYAVHATTTKAYFRNLHSNILLKALGGG